jgi:2-methylfumaryl-CoA hydratase
VQTGERIRVGGPYFEDFEVGQTVNDAPALTLTAGHAALHQALLGDRLRLPLDAALSREVTGREEALAHPNLVCDVAIGQTTGPTQRVRGNLFYRGLVLLRPVFIGDTLRTTTQIVGLKQNRPGSGTGLVALSMKTENQHGEPVLDFWRCPMIPLRDGEAETGHTFDFDEIPKELDMDEIGGAVPGDWHFDRYRELVPGEHFGDLSEGTIYEVEGRDTVTAAPELARLTLNVAMTHTDAGASAHGKRLAYGGHTIAVAAAQATRALPNLLTIVAWRSCDHTGPVFEGDVLSSEITVEGIHPLDGCGLVDLRAVTSAEREGQGEATPVLDWRFLGLMA